MYVGVKQSGPRNLGSYRRYCTVNLFLFSDRHINSQSRGAQAPLRLDFQWTNRATTEQTHSPFGSTRHSAVPCPRALCPLHLLGRQLSEQEVLLYSLGDSCGANGDAIKAARLVSTAPGPELPSKLHCRIPSMYDRDQGWDRVGGGVYNKYHTVSG